VPIDLRTEAEKEQVETWKERILTTEDQDEHGEHDAEEEH
jgi:hypothetical protein